jgi:class 3 adenylate cyclase
MITSAPLEDLARYVPSLILRRLMGDAATTLSPSVEHFPAAILFADLSGFTALTERLTRHSPAGAEDLTRILDGYFGHLVGVVTSHGGDVVKFAGDGLLALWYGDEPLAALAQRAVQCGLAVQMQMAPHGPAPLDDAAAAPDLKVRVGVGAGEVTTMHIGGIFGRWELLVAGEAITRASVAEGEARPGEVVIAPEAWPLVASSCSAEMLPSGAARLTGLVDYLPMRRLATPSLTPQMGDALRSYLPKAIVARLDAGQTAWLAEQRRVTVLFINLPALQATTPLRDAQAMMRSLQRALYRFEGSITRLGTDAKGPTIVAALGLPPLAHEDDAERGVRAAFAIHEALHALDFDVAIGVTSGLALCCAVGAQHRREYTMMGAIVNRSARLMQAAAARGPASGPPILCDEATFRAASPQLSFEPLPQLQLKGVTGPVTVYQALSPEPSAPTATAAAAPSAALVGRERDQQLIAQRVSELARAGDGGALIIEGEAGIGKSSLLAYARDCGRAAGALVASSNGSPVEAPPYHAWRSIFAELFAHGPAAERRHDSIDSMAIAALEELEATDMAPLLGAVLGFRRADTSLTAQLAGQVRADNTRDLLLRLLARAAAHTPILVTIDDAQWLDASSWSLLRAAAEQIDWLLIVLATRPLAEAPQDYQRLAYAMSTQRLRLGALQPEPLRALLAQHLGVAELPDAVWELLATRSQGNPFVGMELLDTLRESGVIVVSNGACSLANEAGRIENLLAADRLPATVQALITSRIDRLTPAQQLTLKVASVLGPSFPLGMLAALHPVEHNPEQLVEQLFALQQAGLVVIEAIEPELVYAFKHAVGADVAYNLMSFAQRRWLHRELALRYEETGGQPLVAAAQLAHHWRQAGEPLRAVSFLGQAGEAALHGGGYQEAARFFAAALAIVAEANPQALGSVGLSDPVLARWERQLGEAYHGVGRLIESREQLERAVARMGFPLPTGARQIFVSLAEELAQQAARLLRRPRWRRPPAATLGEAARAYALLAQLFYYDGELFPATYSALRGLNLAERAGPSAELAGAYGAAHLAVSMLPPLAAIYRRRAHAVADQLGHLPTLGWVAEAQGLYAIGHGNWRRAKAALTVALAVGDRLGDQRRRAEATAARSLVYAHQGALTIALAGCDELQIIGLRSGDVQVRTWGLAGAAESLLALGEHERAMELLGVAEGLVAENFGGARAEEIWVYALMSRAALQRGDHALASALAGAASRLIGNAPPATLYALGGYTAIAEVYLELFELQHPADPAARKAAIAAARRICAVLRLYALIFPVAGPAALTWDALRLQLGGRQRAARRRWARAIGLAARLGMPYAEALAHLQLGRHSAGEPGRQHLERAARLFQRLGCTHYLARARALLAAS